jgi:polar amino acid transport system substrate-binding protein
LLPFSLFLAVGAGAPSAAAPVHDGMEEVRERGEMVWGGDVQGGEPYVYEDPANPKHLIGFEVDIADALGRRLGVKARFSQTDWSNLVPGLERGDFDVVMNGLEDTPERRARILLSHPYFVYGETLAVRKGSGFTGLDDLKGRRVATLNQSYAMVLLNRLEFDVALYEGVLEPYSDLELDRVSGVLLDHIIADRYGCSHPKIQCLPTDVARGTYVIGFRKGDVRLRTAVDGALDAMRSEGELRRILEHWKLWDARQETLAPIVPQGSSASSPAAPSDTEPVRGPWTVAQTLLFLQGTLVTLGLSFASFALAIPLGLALALGRMSRGAPRWASAAYVEVFRGTPLLLQLYVLYFALAPLVRLGPITAAILGLALNYGAYEAEIHRGALLAVPRGQIEAARALGLTRWQALRHVTIPQAFRVALPPMTNDFVALLKDSSLVSVITVVELTKRMTIAAVDLRGWLVPGVACGALYFAISYPLARLAQRLERRLRRDHDPESA